MLIFFLYVLCLASLCYYWIFRIIKLRLFLYNALVQIVIIKHLCTDIHYFSIISFYLMRHTVVSDLCKLTTRQSYR